MARCVRNFYIDGAIDGRSSRVTGGPRNKEGGFHLSITQRDDGGIVNAVRIIGTADEDGDLTLTIIDPSGSHVWRNQTKR